MQKFGTGTLYPDRKGITATAEEYVPSQAQRADPRVNLPLADPQLFPPVYFAAAELDCLRDSSRNMAARLATAGRPHQLKIYPGMTHLFFGFSRMVDRSAECVRDVAGFLAQQVPAKPGAG
jgi:acetyl esterase